jgi:hypothetical protein
MRWSDGNNPTFTLDELVGMVKASAPTYAGDADVSPAVISALRSVSPWMKNPFHFTLPVCECPACEVDLGFAGITVVSNVEHRSPGCTGPSCWRDLPWWRIYGTTMLVSPVVAGSDVRIHFLAEPPVEVLGVKFQMRIASAEESGYATISVADAKHILEPGRIPAGGYIRASDGHVFEYVGYTFDPAANSYTLSNVAQPGWVLPADAVYPYVIEAEFVTSIRDMRLLDVIRDTALANYWRNALSLCTGDEDKSFTSQMMVFFSEERDKRRRELTKLRPEINPRLKFRDEFAVPERCC